MPLHLVNHPVAQDALADLRDRHTPTEHFRRAATRISTILAAEALREAPTRHVSVETPMAVADGRRLDADIVVVPILRAGLSMLDAVLSLAPSARVGYIGLQRDEKTAAATRYYSKLPPGLGASYVLLVDPMLATGGSSIAAISLIKDAGAAHISLVCIIAAPEGVAAVEARHPGVSIYTPAVDHHLNDQQYIIPGLGDFGDRLYGTV